MKNWQATALVNEAAVTFEFNADTWTEAVVEAEAVAKKMFKGDYEIFRIEILADE